MSYRLSLLPLALVAIVAAACSDNSTSPTSDQAQFSSGSGGGGGGPITVTCEKRGTSRSKISVDGRNLPAGRYTARVTSGANRKTSPSQQTVGDEVEFDFDSNRNDIAAGATPIPANFIQVSATPDVRGEILNAAGAVVRSLGVSCRIR